MRYLFRCSTSIHNAESINAYVGVSGNEVSQKAQAIITCLVSDNKEMKSCFTSFRFLKDANEITLQDMGQVLNNFGEQIPFLCEWDDVNHQHLDAINIKRVDAHSFGDDLGAFHFGLTVTESVGVGYIVSISFFVKARRFEANYVVGGDDFAPNTFVAALRYIGYDLAYDIDAPI